VVARIGERLHRRAVLIGVEDVRQQLRAVREQVVDLERSAACDGVVELARHHREPDRRLRVHVGGLRGGRVNEPPPLVEHVSGQLRLVERGDDLVERAFHQLRA
jgi:hypothetical protein